VTSASCGARRRARSAAAIASLTRSVRASDLTKAFNVYGAGSVLQGFGVQRYATAIHQLGAVGSP